MMHCIGIHQVFSFLYRSNFIRCPWGTTIFFLKMANRLVSLDTSFHYPPPWPKTKKEVKVLEWMPSFRSTSPNSHPSVRFWPPYCLCLNTNSLCGSLRRRILIPVHLFVLKLMRIYGSLYLKLMLCLQWWLHSSLRLQLWPKAISTVVILVSRGSCHKLGDIRPNKSRNNFILVLIWRNKHKVGPPECIFYSC